MKEYNLQRKAMIEVIKNNPSRVWDGRDLMNAVNIVIGRMKRFRTLTTFTSIMLKSNNTSFPYMLFRNHTKDIRRYYFVKK